MLIRKISLHEEVFQSTIRTFLIPKGNGTYRKIYSEIDKTALSMYQRTAKELQDEVLKQDKYPMLHHAVHAFVRGRNPVTNALRHIGFKHTISYDLKDFFESVTIEKLKGIVSDDVLDFIMVDGAARQGLPTSPNAANLAFMKVDQEIVNFLELLCIRYSYTRYADDITISFDDLEQLQYISQIVDSCVGINGYVINERKTKLQSARHGRRFITGIAVDDIGIYPTRKNRRRARAALHNCLTWQQTHTGKYRLRRLKQKAMGLKEWCSCKKPRSIE